MITGAQIRAARGALGWSVQKLAERSGVGLRTLVRFEQFDGIPPSRSSTLDVIQTCFEAAGVEFLDSKTARPGIRFQITEK